MLKHEDWPGPGLAKVSAIRAASDRGDVRRISILAGNGGGLFLPEELTRGADGAMTGFAWPEMMVDVCAAHAAGDIERAHYLFDAYLPLARYEQQSALGLAVRKHMMVGRGAIASATLRRPAPSSPRRHQGHRPADRPPDTTAAGARLRPSRARPLGEPRHSSRRHGRRRGTRI